MATKGTIKVFKINDCEWWAAETLEEAIADFKAETGMDDDNVDDARELSEEEMNRFHMLDEGADENTKRTFKEELARMEASGKSFPCFFATTEY